MYGFLLLGMSEDGIGVGKGSKMMNEVWSAESIYLNKVNIYDFSKCGV